MNRTVVILATAFVIAVLTVLVVTTMGTNKYRCEVCISFQGRSACRTAGASTEAQALRAATENACAQISSGVTDSMACGNTAPDSVKWLSGR